MTDPLTPGTQATLDRLTAQARAVIERVPPVLLAYKQEDPPVVTRAVPWVWSGHTRKDRPGHRPPQTPAEAALCAQRRADRAQMAADRRRCGAYPALPMRYI